MATKPRMRFALLAACLTLTAPAYAETQADCEKKIPRQTNMATGTGAGTITGTVIGAKACLGWLGLAFWDWGLSYATCVATVAAVGTIIGTAAGEKANINSLNECIKLAENRPPPSAIPPTEGTSAP